MADTEQDFDHPSCLSVLFIRTLDRTSLSASNLFTGSTRHRDRFGQESALIRTPCTTLQACSDCHDSTRTVRHATHIGVWYSKITMKRKGTGGGSYHKKRTCAGHVGEQPRHEETQTGIDQSCKFWILGSPVSRMQLAYKRQRQV